MPLQREPDGMVIRQVSRCGAELKEDLVKRAGGLLSPEEAAGVLGIAVQALSKCANSQALIAVKHNGALGYPAFQFESEAIRVGVAKILEVIGVDDPWMRLNFMFLRLDELGEMPVDAIRSGRVAAAVIAAKHFGEQGAP